MEVKRRPLAGNQWQHRNGIIYTVLCITNDEAREELAAKFPETVVYENMATGLRWSRPLWDWHRSFKFIAD
jgi:hypothetical protein